MDVALVGLSLPSLPNRALAVLQETVRAARREATTLHFGGFSDVEPVARRIAQIEPRIVGISLSTIESALATMVLVRRMRAHGYRGLVVLGGHFATLNAEAIVEANAEVDLVVRLAGEAALRELACAPDPRSIELHARLPGVVFRGPAGIVIGGPALPVATLGPDVPGDAHLGFAATNLVVSHGCEAHCGYCCIPAAGDLAAAEARRAGRDPKAARYGRLTPDDIAEALARSHREHGTRVVQLMDDNLLPSDADEVTRFSRAVRAGLERRGVPSLALTLQLRADAVTEESAAALAALGVVRVYLGVDGYSRDQLRVLGRASSAEAGQRALDRLAEHHILAVVNALVVGPTVPLSVVRREVEALSTLRRAPVHLLPHEVRAGTPLFTRASKNGLVEGGYLHWHYRFADERTGRVARLLTSLPTRLTERSIPIALYDLAYHLGIVRRLLPALDASGAEAVFHQVTAAWNADQVRVLNAALSCAESDAAVDAWLRAHGPEVARIDRAWRSEVDDAIVGLVRDVSRLRRKRVHAHERGRLLGAVAALMSVGGCAVPAVVDAGRDAGGLDSPFAQDAGVDAEDARAEIVDGCASPDPRIVLGGNCDGAPYRLTFDGAGRVVDVALDADGAMLTAAMRDAVVASFASFCYPSLAGTTQQYASHCWLA